MSIERLRSWSCLSILLLAACADDEGSGGQDTDDAQTETGDGDGDPGDGDPGDGDPGDGDPGDGDGDPGDGDGDGDGDPVEPEFSAGFDVRTLDPNDQQLGTIYLGGFGAPFVGGPATGIHDSLYARSMAVGLGDEGVIFTVVDATGMGNQWTRQIRSQAANLTGLPAEQIIVATTHTHAGPDGQGLWGGVGDSYRATVINETVGSMLAAWQTRQPADLSVSNSTALNHNRRDWDMSDDTVFVLQAHAKDDAALLGTMMSFAAHPVIIGSDNTELSRDYCGYAVDGLEASTGAPVVLFNGILGDVSPSVPEGMYADDFEEADAYGSYVAAQAELMLADAVPVEPILVHGYREWELFVDNALFALAGQLGILDYDFDLMGLTGNVITQSAYVRLGTQVQIVAFPGEPLTRLGLPIKDVMTAPYKAVFGNAGDALGYFIPSDEWMTGLNGDYEEGVSVSMGAGDLSQAEIIALIEADLF